MDNIARNIFLKLFVRNGYVLDFSTKDFDNFTKDSIGVPLCEKYGLSKGASLTTFCTEVSNTQVEQLLKDLLRYYEYNIADTASESEEKRILFKKCKQILIKEQQAQKVSFQPNLYEPEHKTYPLKDNNCLNKNSQIIKNKVFIVHGHDNEAVQEMARTLEKGGFEAVILHEQPDTGMTIIEKIENYSDVAFAVILYTECDLGREKDKPVESEQFRARQNVVFEHGYLISKLGRKHVCALVKGKVEIPGDISGVVYIPMDSNGAWKMRLAKNMQGIGLSIDMNRFCY